MQPKHKIADGKTDAWKKSKVEISKWGGFVFGFQETMKGKRKSPEQGTKAQRSGGISNLDAKSGWRGSNSGGFASSWSPNQKHRTRWRGRREATQKTKATVKRTKLEEGIGMDAFSPKTQIDGQRMERKTGICVHVFCSIPFPLQCCHWCNDAVLLMLNSRCVAVSRVESSCPVLGSDGSLHRNHKSSKLSDHSGAGSPKPSDAREDMRKGRMFGKKREHEMMKAQRLEILRNGGRIEWRKKKKKKRWKEKGEDERTKMARIGRRKRKTWSKPLDGIVFSISWFLILHLSCSLSLRFLSHSRRRRNTIHVNSHLFVPISFFCFQIKNPSSPNTHQVLWNQNPLSIQTIISENRKRRKCQTSVFRLPNGSRGRGGRRRKRRRRRRRRRRLTKSQCATPISCRNFTPWHNCRK